MKVVPKSWKVPFLVNVDVWCRQGRLEADPAIGDLQDDAKDKKGPRDEEMVSWLGYV